VAIEQILDLEQLEVNIYRGSVFSPESGFLQRTEVSGALAARVLPASR
jgi:hypothetical protein